MESLIAAVEQRISQGRPLALAGVPGGARAFLLSRLALRLERPLVVLCESRGRAEVLHEDLNFYLPAGMAWFYPQWDTVPYDSFSPGKEVMATRLSTLGALLDGRVQVLVTTPQAWMQGTMPVDELERLRFQLEPGRQYPRATLVQQLVEAGYVRVDTVEAPGEFCTRGDIVDVFPVQEDQPVRLDFFDADLEGMRWFHVDSQTSFESLDSLHILPASEGVLNPATLARARAALPHHKGQVQPDAYRQLYYYLEQGLPFPGLEQLLGLLYPTPGRLAGYLPRTALLVREEPQALAEIARHFHEEILGEYELCLSQGLLALPPQVAFADPRDLEREVAARPGFTVQSMRMEDGPATLTGPFAGNEALRAPDPAAGHPGIPPISETIARCKAWRDDGARVLIAARSRTAAERLLTMFEEAELGISLRDDAAELLRGDLEASANAGGNGHGPPPGAAPLHELVLLPAMPHQGFRVVDEAGRTTFALVTEEEMLGERTRQRRLKKSKLQNFIASLGELKEGDLVVHVEYGIGRYQGLRRMAVGGEEGDFLVLQYAGEDKVYVPVHKFHMVQKYTGVDAGQPMLNRLGEAAWQRAKAKAGKAIEDMAEDLVAVQAARRTRTGFAYNIHDPLISEFVEAFPYQETEDQATAIEEVLEDLGAEHPMDRLVCGDVGFGKTEVAMRAAYVVVLEGRQVVVLVPTTILAQQHYNTFTNRFANTPVRVEMLSRFLSAQAQKQVVADFNAGQVDILIGTHRLLSKDITPKALGLLVIDEEQRFGVAHKEKIKGLKNLVDVVTLSATPIPRTLNMSLMGVRDLSIINTPPMDRIAVRTRLVRSSDYIITEAVEREVRRGGQVFFVQNRVENIYQYANYLKSLMPERSIVVAHGQMPEKDLEEVMMAFVRGEVEVLLSTSIIESGLDIPRANTIIINNADHFGLAQLYQLRGRVGRSNVQAYAYLLVSPEKVLTDVAQKRLTLLQELNDLGSGFKIASHDLEIRGAGNLLGREQSGHINTIGLELFSQMVEEAVARLTGEELTSPQGDDLRIELGFSFLLPESYIASTRQRLDVYKQLSEIPDEESLWQLRQVLEDRFGRPPAEMGRLFTMIRIRLLARRYGLKALERAGGELQATFGQPDWIDLEGLLALVANPASGLRLLPGDQLRLGPFPDTPEAVLERLQLLEPLIHRGKAA